MHVSNSLPSQDINTFIFQSCIYICLRKTPFCKSNHVHMTIICHVLYSVIDYLFIFQQPALLLSTPPEDKTVALMQDSGLSSHQTTHVSSEPADTPKAAEITETYAMLNMQIVVICHQELYRLVIGNYQNFCDNWYQKFLELCMCIYT